MENVQPDFPEKRLADFVETFFGRFFNNILAAFVEKTRMKSNTTHHSNENLALQTQFPLTGSIVRSFKNFHDKSV
ncbi:MAG: hypothetical protein Q7T80_13665 [Methanoregula sp.]|nr:hypothetical protein [Methanoregula sp.]